jgi:hypothetical protein
MIEIALDNKPAAKLRAFVGQTTAMFRDTGRRSRDAAREDHARPVDTFGAEARSVRVRSVREFYSTAPGPASRNVAFWRAPEEGRGSRERIVTSRWVPERTPGVLRMRPLSWRTDPAVGVLWDFGFRALCTAALGPGGWPRGGEDCGWPLRDMARRGMMGSVSVATGIVRYAWASSNRNCSGTPC